MAVTAITSTISKRNQITLVTKNLATADVDALAEVFTITNLKENMLVVIGGTGSIADGNVAYSFAAGDMFAPKIVSGSVTKNTEAVICVDTAMVKKSNGTILLTLTPAATDKLVTDHAAYVKVIENVG